MYLKSSDGTVTAYLDGEIDHHSAVGIREAIDKEIEKGDTRLLIMDFGDVTFMDSSGIGLVMGRYRQMRYYDGVLKVVNTSDQIYKVMKIAGMDRLNVLEKGAGK